MDPSYCYARLRHGLPAKLFELSEMLAARYSTSQRRTIVIGTPSRGSPGMNYVNWEPPDECAPITQPDAYVNSTGMLLVNPFDR